MRPIGSVAFCLALVSGTVAAQAQTSVTRQITNEPVETVITQGPAGTTVTRRILSPEPGFTYAAPPVEYAPPAPVATEAYVQPLPTVTTRRVTTTRRTANGRRVSTTRTTVARRAPAARTVARATAVPVTPDQPLVLTPSQRQIVYRDIVAREGYPTTAVAPAAPVYAQDDEIKTLAGYPLRTIYPADDYAYRDNWRWDDRYTWRWNGRPVAPVPVTYTVGMRLPATVPLVAVPNAAAARVPVAAPYSYAMVGGRVYLVDPATSIIVADVTQ